MINYLTLLVVYGICGLILLVILLHICTRFYDRFVLKEPSKAQRELERKSAKEKRMMESVTDEEFEILLSIGNDCVDRKFKVK